MPIEREQFAQYHTGQNNPYVQQTDEKMRITLFERILVRATFGPYLPCFVKIRFLSPSSAGHTRLKLEAQALMAFVRRSDALKKSSPLSLGKVE